MRFQVPQFIEIEDKIFGPMTFKQFVYVAGAGGAIVAVFYFLPIFIAFLISVPIGIFAAALAFFKVNNRPFIIYVESMFNYMINKKMYIWQKQEKKGKAVDAQQLDPKKQTAGRKLGDINRKLDIGENLDQKEQMENKAK